MDLKLLLDQITNLAIEQGEVLYKGFDKYDELGFETKQDEVDIVTQLDREVEDAFYSTLSQNFPELGFQLEENASINDSTKEYTCFIDPIDGTKYFAKGVPLFSISVGVMRRSEPVLGMVYNPMTKQLYSASEVSPTMLNGIRVKASSKPDLKSSIISADFASHKGRTEHEAEWMKSTLMSLIDECYRVRLLGQGALSCAWTAVGAMDGIISLQGHAEKPFDIAAGKALIKYSEGYQNS